MLSVGRIELEQAFVADRFALPPQHARDILRRQRIVIEHGPRHRLPRLVQRQPGERLHQRLHAIGPQVDREVVLPLQRAQDLVDDFLQFVVIGQVQHERDGLTRKLARQVDRFAGQHRRRP